MTQKEEKEYRLVSVLLETCVERDANDAKLHLLENAKFNNQEAKTIELLNLASKKDVLAMKKVAMLYYLGAFTEGLNFNKPIVYMHMFIEAVRIAEDLKSKIDEESGLFLLSKFLFGPPKIFNRQGREVKEVMLQIDLLGHMFSNIGWDKYDLLLCGCQYLFGSLIEGSPKFNVAKAKEVAKDLEEEDQSRLEDCYFIIMGSEYIKGTNFPYDPLKAKSMFQVLYDRGHKIAFDHMSELMKKYHRDSNENANVEKTEKKGCYVATCVYGSYDCPEVWVLRRYRDYYLNSRWWGKAFVKIYYFFSPIVVKMFGSNKHFIKVWKSYLSKKVNKLIALGYETTKYYDD